MSIKNVQRFFEMLTHDKSLREKLSPLQEKYGKKRPESVESQEKSALNDIVLLAGKAGFDFTPDELKDYSLRMKNGSSDQLTDDELEAVSGAGSCYCLIGGGGRLGDETTCACVGFGLGNDNQCVCVGVGFADW